MRGNGKWGAVREEGLSREERRESGCGGGKVDGATLCPGRGPPLYKNSAALGVQDSCESVQSESGARQEW